jgi:DNA uptake protein ComE-like DNA-binding protein
MLSNQALGIVILCAGAALAVAAAGCRGNEPNSASEQAQRERDQKTRDEVARATERAKPVIQEAGKELGRAAAEVAEQAHAAAQGVEEGWKRGGNKVLDLNSAGESELTDLPGITRDDARKIVAGRPYHNKHQLVTKRILSEEDYLKIRDRITLK